METKQDLLLQGQMMNIRGKELYVELHGSPENPPVLYLHGGPGESCYDFSFHQAERLRDSFYLIALDQRGVCRSEAIAETEPFGLQDLIEDCEALREKLQVDRWSIIGHSFGGFLALLYATTYPQSIHKIIFEGPTFDFELTTRSLLKKTGALLKKYGKEELSNQCVILSESNASSKELLEGYLELSDELEEQRMEIYCPPHVSDETDYNLYSEEEWEVFYHRSDIHFTRLREEGKVYQSLLPKLQQVSQQMLLLIGKYDAVTCEKQIETFLRDVRNGKIIVLEDSGHTPHYEAADRFAEIVIDYLK
ncbi:alpha/beta hydrolase [Bacillus sp. DX1.1]|uniref:alpha/beta fold hydrolase n=1 Tax=unclassified Bacillus (in: firmicutes) TaxID=185979 RepID=UPI0025701A3C|nr:MULTISPECIES: alpha/beta hydrolase [unclassified Bacillus (in: firmicutes)]MDM5154774.1 alpha/beta hydrolase [Bacillus sp. DX1.1]WJE83654.1 alpha/beta hydrolase [Bacillus sp. DX3.1]